MSKVNCTRWIECGSCRNVLLVTVFLLLLQSILTFAAANDQLIKAKASTEEDDIQSTVGEFFYFYQFQNFNCLLLLIDKRAPRRYDFGLGKRVPDGDQILINKSNLIELLKSFRIDPSDYNIYALGSPVSQVQSVDGFWDTTAIKRLKPQRFSFGLGKKRSLAEVNKEQYNENNEDIGSEQEKRKGQRYQFGIGKRLSDGRDRMANFEEFMKRRYSFGLGKRSI